MITALSSLCDGNLTGFTVENIINIPRNPTKSAPKCNAMWLPLWKKWKSATWNLWNYWAFLSVHRSPPPTEYFYSYGCMPIAPKTSARMYTIREYSLLPLLSPCISPPVPVFFLSHIIAMCRSHYFVDRHPVYQAGLPAWLNVMFIH